MRNLLARTKTILLVVLLLGSAASFGQQSPAAPQNTKRATSTPYTGDLSIFESPGREQRLHIDRVMDILAISPGKAIADIGAGSGWFTVRAARRTGPSGKVYAVDINPEAIHYIDERVRKESLHNVETILNTADDPKLPKDSVDAVLLLKTYHEIADPVALMKQLRPSLRAGARVGLIDRNGNGTDHGIAEKVVVDELAQAGFHLLKSYDFVKEDGMDYFLVFSAQ